MRKTFNDIKVGDKLFILNMNSCKYNEHIISAIEDIYEGNVKKRKFFYNDGATLCEKIVFAKLNVECDLKDDSTAYYINSIKEIEKAYSFSKDEIKTFLTNIATEEYEEATVEYNKAKKNLDLANENINLINKLDVL